MRHKLIFALAILAGPNLALATQLETVDWSSPKGVLVKIRSDKKPRKKARPPSSLRSQALCYYVSANDVVYEGQDASQLLPLASVSKVVTSQWAIDTLGGEHRFETKVYVTPVSDSLYDVHIQGAFDPDFTRERLQFLVAELNELGVRRIRNLTFDENFIYVNNLEIISATDPIPHNPYSDRTMTQLRRGITSLKSSYSKVRNRFRKLFNESLRQEISMTAADISFLPSPEFVQSAETKAYSFKSAPLKRVLREMNKHSNNHVSEYIFQGLGGREHYLDYQTNNLQIPASELVMYNGSGAPHYEGREKFYNKAACNSVIRVMTALETDLQSQNSRISEVIHTVGDEADSQNPSGLTNFYDSSVTHMAVTAKTGTVDPMITLAGQMSTQHGPVYFAIFQPTRSDREWSRGRNAISKKLDDLIANYGQRKIEETDSVYLSFDLNSKLVKLTK